MAPKVRQELMRIRYHKFAFFRRPFPFRVWLLEVPLLAQEIMTCCKMKRQNSFMLKAVLPFSCYETITVSPALAAPPSSTFAKMPSLGITQGPRSRNDHVLNYFRTLHEKFHIDPAMLCRSVSDYMYEPFQQLHLLEQILTPAPGSVTK